MQVKAALFDFMGTCLDWHSSVVSALPTGLSEDQKSRFALEWRQAYFDHNAERIRLQQPVQDFDDTQREVLDRLLEKWPADVQQVFDKSVKEGLVVAYHHQKAWPDVIDALKRLRQDLGLEVYVHANGSTRLQLDLCKSAGLHFDMLFSSELLDVYKPEPESYTKALRILKLKPEECVTVAAHAYDTRGAKVASMKTVYVYRWTDDILEDQGVVKQEHDAYLLDMSELPDAIASLGG